jgi:hypothetical protein
LTKQYELEFRELIYPIIKSLNSPKPRLPVVFCKFTKLNFAIGETPGSSSLFSWEGPFDPKLLYSGPLILIGVNNVSKRTHLVLAHEIGHAGGCYHQDTPNNIMNGGQENKNFGKPPTDLYLEQLDKEKLEKAFFVI